MEYPWIEVFRAGEWTDMSGQTNTWTTEDLNKIVDTYNNFVESHPNEKAPLVIGHPETDSPKFGSVEKLRLVGDTIEAMPEDVHPDLEKAVNEKRFDKISIALNDDMMLRHVGFLGAAMPAVKGLEPVKFSSPAKTTIEFAMPEKPVEPKPVEKKPIAFAFPIKLNESLKRNKPELYKEYSDNDFADPVHFRFPLKKASEAKASMAIFSWANVQGQYSETEKQFIAGRLMKAALGHNIKPNPKSWKYVDVPVDALTKQQLIDLVNKHETNKLSSNNPQRKFAMDEKLQQLHDSLIAKVSEQINEEAATQVSAIWDGLIAEIYPAAPEAPAEGTPAVQASEQQSNPEVLALRQELEALKTKDRMNEHSAYAESLVQSGKITPFQKGKIVKLLELGFTKQSFEFAEGGKTAKVNGVELVKSFCDSLEKRMEFGEIATGENARQRTQAQAFALPKGADLDESKMDEYNKVKAYMEEQAKVNRVLTIEQAWKELSSKS